MARIVHRGEVRGNGGVLEGEWAESRQSLEGVRRRAKLGKDLEETKLVGCGEKSRDWSVPGE